MRRDMTPELPIEAVKIFAMGLDHPEAVAFDRYGDLWTGGELGQIYRITSDGKISLVANIGGSCGGMAFSPKNELLVCNSAQGLIKVMPDGDWSVFATHARDRKLFLPRHGVFDGNGNYYVTDAGRWKKNEGCLVRYRAGTNMGEMMIGSRGYMNGIALSADQTSLFIIESDCNRLLRLELKPDGSLGNLETLEENLGRFPNGIAVDAGGNLYVSSYASDEIWRVPPGGNRSLLFGDEWGIQLGGPAGLAFGGPGLNELYVANSSRTTITRIHLKTAGEPLAPQRTTSRVRPRPMPL